jgi:hypothetical protein
MKLACLIHHLRRFFQTKCLSECVYSTDMWKTKVVIGHVNKIICDYIGADIGQ